MVPPFPTTKMSLPENPHIPLRSTVVPLVIATHCAESATAGVTDSRFTAATAVKAAIEISLLR
jgi:hypothetical protein